MEISIKCTVGNQNAHDWAGMAKAAYGFAETLPAIGNLLTSGEKLSDMWGAWKNVDDGFGKQWKSCIQGWITTAIDDKARAETMAHLKDMGVKMTTIMKPLKGSGQISNYEFDQINENIHSLQDNADYIKDQAAGAKDPVEFLMAYDAALANELTIAYLFIAKMKQTSRTHIKDLAHTFSARMVEYRTHLVNMETNVLKSFFNDWKIKHSESTDETYTTGFLKFTCKVEDPTSRLKEEALSVSGLIRRCLLNLLCDVETDKQPYRAKCNKRLSLMNKMVKNAQDKVHGILDGMKGTVEKAIKIFGDLAAAA